MNLETIRNASRKHPFRPFVIRFADGRALPVPHPEFVALTNRIAIVVDHRLNGAWYEVAPLLVDSVDYADGDGATLPTATP